MNDYKIIASSILFGLLTLISASAMSQTITLLCTEVDANYEIVPGDHEVTINLTEKKLKWNQREAVMKVSPNELSVNEPKLEVTLSRLTLEYQRVTYPKKGAQRTEPFISSGKCRLVNHQI